MTGQDLGSGSIPLVRSLSGLTPSDGMLVRYQDATILVDGVNTMAALGVAWLLAYNGLSASGSKWEYVGGSPLVVSLNATDTISSTTFVALPTATALIAPLAGDYEVGFSCGRVDCAAPDGVGQVFVSVSINGVTAVAANQAGWRTVNFDPGGRVQRFNGVNASGSVALQAMQNSGNGRVFERDLWIRPMRVG